MIQAKMNIKWIQELFVIWTICVIFCSNAQLFGQPPLQYVQYSQSIENTNTPGERINNRACVSDSGHGVFFVGTGRSSITKLDKIVYDSKKGVCGFIARYDFTGSLKWSLPIYGVGSIYNAADKLQGKNAIFLFGGSLKIGNDSATGPYTIVAIDTMGMNDYMVSFPRNVGIVLSQTLTLNKRNNVTIVVRFDTATNFEGLLFDKGLFSLEFDKKGKLLSNVRLGYSSSSQAISDCIVTDSAIYFNGVSIRGYPFIGNDFSVRAIDSNTHPGIYSADNFLACVSKSGTLNWLKRVDTMGVSNQVGTLAQTSNGNLFWVVNYYKTGVVFGKKLQVNFPGYGYSYLAVLNPAGDIIKEYYVDTVGGGNDNILTVQSSSNFSEILLKTVGTDEGYRKWKNLPDSAKSIFETSTVIRFDSLGNFTQFNGAPYSLANTYRNGFGIATLEFRPFMSDYTVNGVPFINKGGNDYAFWYITAFKPYTTQIRNTSVSGFLVFPNPARDEFRIVGLPDQLDMDLMIYNALGIEVKKLHRKSGNDESFEITDLPDGMYFIQLKVGGVCVDHSIKLMVQH